MAVGLGARGIRNAEGLDFIPGSNTLWAVVNNRDEVRVPFDQEKSALLVPDTALGSDQGGRYVLVVSADNVVEQRKVQIGPVDNGLRVIESGLKPEDRVVIAGLLRVIPGQKIDPQVTKIEQSQASSK